MKKFVINLFILLLFSISFLFIYLSIYGHETTKFNNLISTKINKIEKNIVINFEKIKIKIDMKNFNFYLLTRKPKLLYKNNEVPISEIKVYIIEQVYAGGRGCLLEEVIAQGQQTLHKTAP